MELVELLSLLLMLFLSCVVLAVFIFSCIGIHAVYSKYKDSKWEKEYGPRWKKLEEENDRNEWEEIERLRDKIFLFEEALEAKGFENIIEKIVMVISNVNYNERFDDYKKNENLWKIVALSSMSGGFGASEKAQHSVDEGFEKYEKQRKKNLQEQFSLLIEKEGEL